MNMAVTLKIYDPLKGTKRMEKAGFKKELAESIAEEIKESQDSIISDLATKQDLLVTKKELMSEISLVRVEIKNAMLTTIISIGGIVVAGITIVTWLSKVVNH